MKLENAENTVDLENEKSLPWDCPHNLYISISAPDNPLENERIYNSCFLSLEMSLRYNLIFDALAGELARMGKRSYTPGLQTLRIIGIDIYDHPVTLDFRFLADPILVEDPKVLDSFCESARRIQQIVLPRWNWRGLERIEDAEDDKHFLRRLLSDPNDLVIEHRL